MTDGATSADLATALSKFELAIEPLQRELLERYAQALWAWNSRLNLTRHTDYDRFVSRDVLDAHMLAALIQEGEEILDVGSGGGVPGVVLAILRPDIQVAVCESVQKKARALQEIVQATGLSVPVYHARAESLLEDFRFTSLTVRAVGSISKLLRWFSEHWSSFDRLLLTKGPKWVAERGEARHLGLLNNLQLRRLAQYADPLSHAESVILEIRPKPSPESDG